MRVVKQYNNHACGLACIESFLRDQGIDVSQHQILADFPHLCHAGDAIEGALDLDLANLNEIGQAYGFGAAIQQQPLTQLAANETYLVATRQPSKHCMRWGGNVVGGRLQLMDPGLNRDNESEEYRYASIEKLNQHQCSFFRIRIHQVPGAPAAFYEDDPVKPPSSGKAGGE